MIEVSNITKKFGNVTALNSISCNIQRGNIYGIVGSNGAGKSTLLRLMMGIYSPDGGEITIDGAKVYDNPVLKNKMVFVADELFFLPQSNMLRMAELYSAYYPEFTHKRFMELSSLFRLDVNASLSTFSKGMRRQAAVILSLCCNADYIMLDETFDGLDPVMRELVKRAIYAEMDKSNVTAIIASHSLRELEDTCDQLALLHRGGIVLESDIGNLKTSLNKIQVAFSSEYGDERFLGIEVVSKSRQGSVTQLIARGDKDEVAARLAKFEPILMEVLPLTLEEVFIHEMSALGYEFDSSILSAAGEA